jgi:choline dehydrogenase-like flavoprotein
LFHDTRTLDDGAEVRADVCIVGAGAAGIAIANELRGGALSVALLTSGEPDFRRRPQRLYAGDDVGRSAYSTYRSRVRMYGGSTTRWTGQCRPLERLDFERRDWVRHSGWPFSRDGLEPYYRRAQDVCNLGPYDYEPTTWSSNGRRVLPVDRGKLDVRVYQFAHPLDFGKVYRDALASARNVGVYLRANVVEIEVDPDVRRVTGLRVATFNGTQVRFVAGSYVLACGGIENPRLLLASNRVASAGLGNRHDLVGRFYTDHPFFFTGYYDPSRPDLDETLHVIEDYERVGWEQRAHAALALPERTIRAEQLNDCAVYFVRRPNYKIQPSYFTAGVKSFTHLVDLLRREDLPDRRLPQHLRNVAGGLTDLTKVLTRQVVERVRPQPRLALRTALETTPNPDSRVTLGERRDQLGMPRVRVDWRLNADDKRGLHRLYEVMREEFARLGLGRLVEDPAVDATGWPVSSSSGMHHMGTTRMHENPREGVVDPYCRVHDLANLYVAGSSVFPTGGVANPTLTIVALAIRLADHLKQRQGAGRVE